MTNDDNNHPDDRATDESRAEETQPPREEPVAEEPSSNELNPERDERSREESAGRDADAPLGAFGSGIAPEAKRVGRDRIRLRRDKKSAGILIGVLTAILGFAIAVQVRSNSSSDSLSNAREDDLIRILDDQNARAERLDQQIADLQATLDELQRSGNSDAVAQQQAERELQSLEVLLGTVPATGPGITADITDPQHKLKAEDLLDVVEELRGAGAESIQFGSVRVTTATSFTDSSDGVQVDGQQISPPYRVLAIGDPKTLDTALNIPGGVAATARNAGGDAQIVEQQQVDITARSSVPSPKYAAPGGR
ncbi:MAG TPA: DUF881 domain-containing protein [Jatrophihabitantaceae bacterium]|jgi:uncharacterized protein YlxW (UPF0749 family)